MKLNFSIGIIWSISVGKWSFHQMQLQRISPQKEPYV